MSFAISRTTLNRGPTVFPLQSTQHPMRNLPESVISVNARQPNEQVRVFCGENTGFWVEGEGRGSNKNNLGDVFFFNRHVLISAVH